MKAESEPWWSREEKQWREKKNPEEDFEQSKTCVVNAQTGEHREVNSLPRGRVEMESLSLVQHKLQRL